MVSDFFTTTKSHIETSVYADRRVLQGESWLRACQLDARIIPHIAHVNALPAAISTTARSKTVTSSDSSGLPSQASIYLDVTTKLTRKRTITRPASGGAPVRYCSFAFTTLSCGRFLYRDSQLPHHRVEQIQDWIMYTCH